MFFSDLKYLIHAMSYTTRLSSARIKTEVQKFNPWKLKLEKINAAGVTINCPMRSNASKNLFSFFAYLS